LTTPGYSGRIGTSSNERKEKTMPKYRNLTEKWLAEDRRFLVSYDTRTFKYGIVDVKTGNFISPNRWVSRKITEEYLAVSIALGKI
jgi:hypothetical protein